MIKLCLLIVLFYAALNLLHLRAEVYFNVFDARAATAVYPWDHRYHFMLGMGNFMAKRYPYSVNSFRRVVELAPYHLQALNGLAVTYAMMGKEDKARETFNRALHLSPDHPTIKKNLATLAESGSTKFEMLLIKE